ncbi:nitroreductase family protein [Campylobacter gastrosuis]|uniref:Nitroreductase family protein n=1 Tax=Campylobacter gastrosuis TaxID=2974576 RepID=A0ABT7HR77_9BACT|nr:nitroreductase family protein [Campylobacter gastrosuis]MDL0089422.1 nitroreductase family protein [Campylobacter gastrosuis]
MQILEAMQKRRCVRKFNDETPNKEQIEAVLEAGFLAPAVFTTKDAIFSVITDKNLFKTLDEAALKRFAPLLENMGMSAKTTLYDAPVYIIISGKLATSVPPECVGATLANIHANTYWAAGSIMQNMQLRATSLGLSSCLINSVVVTLLNEPELKKLAKIPDDYSPLCSIVLGKSDETPESNAPKSEHYKVIYA